MSDTTPLKGKLALVTGGSRGIGAAIALRLAADGAIVVVNFARSEGEAQKIVRQIEAAGGQAAAVHADLGSNDGPRNLLAGLDAAFGRKFAGKLDILVNNAGTAEWGGALDTPADAYLAQYDKQFALNVRTPVALVNAVVGRMKSAGWGRIINIGSCLGEKVPFPGGTLYAATKFALAGLTRGWSREFGPLGITVNTVQPGPIDTELNPADGPNATMQKGLTSLGRYGKPEEVAAAVAFVASPAASYLNGSAITVDGGWNS